MIAEFRAGAVQAASLTRYYTWAPALPEHSDFLDTNWLAIPLPPTIVLQAGDQIRVYDNNAVDAAADDMVVQMQYAYRAV